MHKKIVGIAILGVFISSGIVHAQTNNILPSAGIKPDNVFFFLDRFGESIQEFFTFNSEAKARLQIKFAGERIAEIDAIVEEKGPDAKGVEKAKTLLLGNVAYAAKIVKEEKAGGKDVSQLAKELDDKFDAQEKLLVQTFQDARKKLREDRLTIKKSLAEQSGDISLTASLEQQIKDLELQDNKLKDAKDEIKKSLRHEKEKIEGELDAEDKKVDEQDKIEQDKQEKVDEVEIEDKDEEVEKQEAPELKESGEENENNTGDRNDSEGDGTSGEDN